MDFSKALINCSALPAVMSIPRDCRGLTEKQKQEYESLSSKESRTEKQQKKYEEYQVKIRNEGNLERLSGSAISKLKDIYIREKWGKEVVGAGKDYVPAVLNGVMSEHESIKMLSEFDDVEYKKHKKLVKNKYIKGILDCYVGQSVKKAEKIVEVKTSPSMQALLSLIRDEETKTKHYWQLMGYMAITGAPKGEVCHCLVSYPEQIINEEINRMLFRTRGLGLDSEYIDKQITRIRHNMTFDEIPPAERIIRFKVQRDEEAIKLIYKKVKLCRNWLNEFDSMHSNMNI